MGGERRAKEKQTRQIMLAELNDDQKSALTQFEISGWGLIFVRRTLGQPAIPALKNSDSGHYAILKPDGFLNEDHEMIVRLLLSS